MFTLLNQGGVHHIRRKLKSFFRQRFLEKCTEEACDVNYELLSLVFISSIGIYYFSLFYATNAYKLTELFVFIWILMGLHIAIGMIKRRT